MPKARPLCTSARQRGAQQAHASQNCVSHLGGFGEEFYSNGSRVGLLTRLGCVQELHSSNLVSGNLLDKLLWFLSSCLRWFLGCSSLDQQLFESTLWDSGKVMEMGVFLTNKKQGTEVLQAQEPHRVLLSFNPKLFFLLTSFITEIT